MNLGKAGGLSGIKKVVAGGMSSCFLTISGTLYTCGNNDGGQLGRIVADGTGATTNVGPVPGVSEIVDVAVSSSSGNSDYMLIVTSSGAVYSCGSNDYGQLGRNVASGTAASSNLAQIPDLPAIKAVAAGSGNAYFLTVAGTVYSCGNNDYGQLGRGVPTGSASSTNLGFISGLSGIVAISANQLCAFFLSEDGQVYSCGYNYFGTLGGTVGSGYSFYSNLGLNTGLSDIIAVSSGREHTLFLTSDRKVYSCGRNMDGELGRTTTDGARSLSNLGRIPGLSSIVSVAAGYAGGPGFSVFVDSSGKAYSCGVNSLGQLGRVSGPTQEPRVNVGCIPDLAVDDVTWSNYVLCIKTPDDEWYSCGNNRAGNLGRVAFSGDAYDPSLAKITSPLSIRKAYDKFFLTTGGDVYSFGSNYYGNLGRAVGDGSEMSSNLGQVAGIPAIADIVSDNNRTCFRTSAGQVYSCGYNMYGELGRVVANGSPSAINLGQVTGVSNISKIFLGARTFFINTSGAVYSCGMNAYCGLGRNVITGSATVSNLGQTTGLSNVVDIYPNSNNASTYFRTSSGAIYSCGQNDVGQLGRNVASGDYNGASGNNLAAISGLSNITSVVQYDKSVYFLSSSGAVWSCGSNTYGQLGMPVNSGTPTAYNLTQITGLSAVQQVVADAHCAFFLTNSGEVYSCGRNYCGALGRVVADGTATVRNLGKIEGLPMITSVAAASINSKVSVFFLASSGEVYTCGNNDAGQLGRAVPTGSATVSNLGKIDGLPPIHRLYVPTYSYAYFFSTSNELWSCGYPPSGLLGRATDYGIKPIIEIGRVLRAA
jgi:alpha-tubulin suppressor-like RCC1 family protein